MDEHVARSITLGLRQRGVDVVTAQEDGRSGASDVALLDHSEAFLSAASTQDLLSLEKDASPSSPFSRSAGSGSRGPSGSGGRSVSLGDDA
jgi:hypothetical protein